MAVQELELDQVEEEGLGEVIQAEEGAGGGGGGVADAGEGDVGEIGAEAGALNVKEEGSGEGALGLAMGDRVEKGEAEVALVIDK